MKKQFLFGMAAVAALCSCSNNEVLEAPESLKTPIAFGTYVGNSVDGRAAVIGDAALQGSISAGDEWSNQAGFGVFAYYTGGKTYEQETSLKPNFMYNEKVYYESPAWKYNILKYWPNNTNDKVSFFAYAPYAKGDGTNTNITFKPAYIDMKAPQINFTVNKTVKNQQDLLWAQQLNKTKPSITAVDPVKFSFAHALARVGFKVEAMFDKKQAGGPEGAGTTAENAGSTNGTYDPNQTIISVKKVELIGNFHKSGTLDLKEGAFVADSYTTIDYLTTAPSNTHNGVQPTAQTGFELDYNATEASSNFVKTVAEGVTTTAQLLNAADSYIMLIPQDFSSATEDDDMIKIRVTYTVTTTDSKLENGQSAIVNVITSDPFTFNFEAKKAYTFNLHLGMTSAKFSATVQDWENNGDDNGTVVNVPINTAD